MYNPFFPSHDVYRKGRILDNAAANWLYGQYDQNKLSTFEMLYAIPGVRQYIDYKLDVRADNEYLNRYGMDYTDVHDPRKLRQTSSGASLYAAAYRMVSKNLDDLYEDAQDKTKGRRPYKQTTTWYD